MLKSSAGGQHNIGFTEMSTTTATYNSRVLGYEKKKRARHTKLTCFLGGIQADMEPSDVMHYFVKLTFDSGCRGSVLNVQLIPKKVLGSLLLIIPTP